MRYLAFIDVFAGLNVERPFAIFRICAGAGSEAYPIVGLSAEALAVVFARELTATSTVIPLGHTRRFDTRRQIRLGQSVTKVDRFRR